MSDAPKQEVVTDSPIFSITRITLMPEDTVAAPMGKVLHVGFAGTTAFAWVQHHPADPRVMNLVTLPTGGPFTLETAEGFKPAVHVGSFQKTAAVQMSKQVEQKVAMAWHVFAWYPLPDISTLN